MNELTVIIPSWNTRELLRRCLASCEPLARAGAQVLVVDDASDDGSVAAARSTAPWATVVASDRRRGFTAAVNRGWQLTERSFVLLLNADAELMDGCADRLLEHLRAQPDYAVAAPRHLNPDGSTQRGVMAFPRPMTALCFATPLERWLPRGRELRRYFMADWDQENSRDVEQPPASALMLRRAAVARDELLDGAMELFFSDVDLCHRLRQEGWRLRYLAQALVVHERGASTAQRGDFVVRWHGDRLAYYRKHFGRAGVVWVKLCTLFAASDELLNRLWNSRPVLRHRRPALGSTAPAFVVAPAPPDTAAGAQAQRGQHDQRGQRGQRESLGPLLRDLFTFLRS